MRRNIFRVFSDWVAAVRNATATATAAAAVVVVVSVFIIILSVTLVFKGMGDRGAMSCVSTWNSNNCVWIAKCQCVWFGLVVVQNECI